MLNFFKPLASQFLARNDECPPVRMTFLTLIESAGLWMLALLIGVAMIAGLLLSVQTEQANQLRRMNFQVVLDQLDDQLEIDLSLGFDLFNNQRVQEMIKELVDRDQNIQAIEIFDPEGLSLFNTDRGVIGERVPESWLAALAHAQHSEVWYVMNQQDTVLGSTLLGPFNEVAGYIAVTIINVPPPDTLQFILHALLVGLFVALCCPLVAWWALRARQGEKLDQNMMAASTRLRKADRRLQVATAVLRDSETEH